MSDEQTNRTDAGRTTGTTSATTMPPTPPVGAEAAGATKASTATGSAPAGPGPDTGEREAVDSVGAESGTPLSKAADAAADAARTASARIKEAAENADLDRFAEDAKRVTGEWTEKIREEYRRRPGVVIGAAVAGVIVLGAIARAIGRR